MRIGFLGLLTLVFITLKLTNYIAWSWLWVLSPLWIGFIVWLLILIVMMAFLAVMHSPKNKKNF